MKLQELLIGPVLAEIQIADPAFVRPQFVAFDPAIVFEDFLDEAGQIEGVCGASRLVCKTFWDYKMIIKFEDHDSIVNYMENHNDAINEAFLPRIQALAVGEVKQQNFVYDDIE